MASISRPDRGFGSLVTSPTRISTLSPRRCDREVHAEIDGLAVRRRGEDAIGLRGQRHDLLRVGLHRLVDLLDEMLGDVDAALEVEIAVGLGENRDAVAQPGVVVAEARAMIEGAPRDVAGIGGIDARVLAAAAVLGREVAVVIGAPVVRSSASPARIGASIFGSS